MKILGIDTCSHKCSVGILDEEKGMLFEEISDMARGHAEHLFPMIEDALSKSKLDIDDIDAFACSVGPGAFTGIRIGIAAIRGFGIATGKPVVGIKTADAIIDQLKNYDNKEILLALESKRNDVYWQLFDKDKKPLNDMSVSYLEDVADYLQDKDLIVIGDGSDHLKDLLPNALFGEESVPKPASICKLALGMIKNDCYKDTCEPVYLRQADVSYPKNNQNIKIV